MTDLTGLVVAALEPSIRPSLIARGATVRVVGVDDGVATLEVTGSPGAVLPVASRIEAQIRAAVPAVTTVRIVTPGAQLPDAQPPDAQPTGVRLTESGAAGSLAEQARRILDAEVNPAIAAHRGHVILTGADEGWVRIRLEGGCQGCSLAEVTVRQGIELLLRARLPDLIGLTDVTDHEAGTQPYFSPEKR